MADRQGEGDFGAPVAQRAQTVHRVLTGLRPALDQVPRHPVRGVFVGERVVAVPRGEDAVKRAVSGVPSSLRRLTSTSRSSGTHSGWVSTSRSGRHGCLLFGLGGKGDDREEGGTPTEPDAGHTVRTPDIHDQKREAATGYVPSGPS